jgi:hypothetical protein
MQLNIDFDKIRLVYLQQEIVKLEKELSKERLSKRAYKGWVKKKSTNN